MTEPKIVLSNKCGRVYLISRHGKQHAIAAGGCSRFAPARSSQDTPPEAGRQDILPGVDGGRFGYAIMRYPPTIRYSALCSFNNASRSLKSSCTSILLLPKEVHSGHTFRRGAGKPIGEVLSGRRVLQAALLYYFLYHDNIIA